MMQRGLPDIVMTSKDHARLSALARIVSRRLPEVSEFLSRELDRARVITSKRVGGAIVAMGSLVEFTYDNSSRTETATLVFPGEEDINLGRISVLTPVGAALIGLSEGQSLTFRTLRGEERRLTVIKVYRQAYI